MSGANCPGGELSGANLSRGRVVWGELSRGRVVWGELSRGASCLGRIVQGAKCPGGELSGIPHECPNFFFEISFAALTMICKEQHFNLYNLKYMYLLLCFLSLLN